MPLEHRASGLALDIVLAGPGLEELFLERAISIDVAGTVVPFISPEDLVVTMVLAGRGKDIDDAFGVLSERESTLDLDQIRTTLRLLEDALGQSDLMPVFDAELSRWQRSGQERSAPDQAHVRPQMKRVSSRIARFGANGWVSGTIFATFWSLLHDASPDNGTPPSDLLNVVGDLSFAAHDLPSRNLMNWNRCISLEKPREQSWPKNNDELGVELEGTTRTPKRCCAHHWRMCGPLAQSRPTQSCMMATNDLGVAISNQHSGHPEALALKREGIEVAAIGIGPVRVRRSWAEPI